MPKEKRMMLSVEVGTQLTVEIEGIQTRVKCDFVGIKPGSYLIVEMPPTAGITDKISEGKRVTARYLYFGSIYGFRAKILRANIQPFWLMLLSYPESVESHNLRKKDRVPCFIPARAKVIETELKGVILDLSSDGCKFAMNVSENTAARFFKTEDEMTMFLPLLGKDGAEPVQAIIRHVIEDGDKRILGIQFENPSQEITSQIGKYIEDVKEFT